VPAKDIGGSVGESDGRSRGAALVVHDAQLITFAGEPQHREEEVLSARAIYPARSEDQVAAARCLDRLVALELAPTVDRQRIGRVSLDVGPSLRAIVDVVGGVVNQQRTRRFRLGGEESRAGRVNQERLLVVGLGFVHCGIGRGIHDHVGLYVAYARDDGDGVGNVELPVIEREDLAERRERALEFPADLPIAARQEDLQPNTSAFEIGGALRSRSDTIASPDSGHRMPIVGSFQRIARSH